MILLHGEHVLSDSYTKCEEPLPDNGYFIYDLETFEMIGTEPAHNVVVILSVGVHLMNIFMSHFKSISFYNTSNSKDDSAGTLTLPGYEVREVRHYSQSVFITVLNRILFNGVVPNQYTIRPINFSLAVMDSTFTNKAGIIGYSLIDLN